jgi:glycosyltransferase involved in cell wall biosynthesis
MVNHSHGLLWTAEFDLGGSAHAVNRDLVKSAILAKEITTPSDWVAQAYRRDMRIDPTVVWHGVNWDEWQHDLKNEGYVLWGKNRTSDGLSPMPVKELAEAFPNTEFITTFSVPGAPSNVKSLQGTLPHKDFKTLVQSAAVVLATDRETWGILPAEAMAAGVPVLSVDAGATPDFMKHGVAGYCYQPGNFEDARNGLDFCLRNYYTLGANGRELAKKLDWRVACETVAGIYRWALKPEEPTVAIVIPTYNYGHRLSGAIESAVNQSYEGIESIVVVDDGSTDDTTELVGREWANRDQRVIYRRQQNSGVAPARNEGARISGDSKYLIFLDADDRIEPYFTERLVRELEKFPGSGVAYTGVKVLLPDDEVAMPHDWGQPLEEGQLLSKNPWPRDFSYEEHIDRKNQIPTCCLIRRKAFDRVGGYRARYCPRGAGSEDAEMFLRLGAIGWDMNYVIPWPNSLFVHRHGEGYVSGKLEDYTEPDWTSWHPWTKDGKHPFGSVAKPEGDGSHAIRSYEKPLVSVVIPVGNGHEENVVDALDSLEAQTFRNWEAVVVWDTGDNTKKQLKSIEDLKRTYPYIRCITQGGTSIGAGAARNMGVWAAKSPFIAFLDADDYYHKHYLESAISAYVETGNVIYSDFVSAIPESIHGEYGGEIVGRRPMDNAILTVDTSPGFDCEKAMQRPEGNRPYLWCGVTMLLPKIWHDEIGGFDESMDTWEDIDYILRLAWSGKCFTQITRPLWVYNFLSGHRRTKQTGKEKELTNYLAEKYDELVGAEHGM